MNRKPAVIGSPVRAWRRPDRRRLTVEHCLLEPMAQTIFDCTTVHPGNMGRDETLQAMLKTVSAKDFPCSVSSWWGHSCGQTSFCADRVAASLDQHRELMPWRIRGVASWSSVLRWPCQPDAMGNGRNFRWPSLCDVSLTEEVPAEATFAGHRLIVAHDPDPCRLANRPSGEPDCQTWEHGRKSGARLALRRIAGETARGRRASPTVAL